MDHSARQEIIGDAHVHFHSCYRWTEFLSAAHENLTRYAAGGTQGEHQLYCLVFTETENEKMFDLLVERARSGTALPTEEANPTWRALPTAEDCSVRLTDGARSLTVVAGSQIAAREDLEVLVVGSRRSWPDGLPIRELLQRTQHDNLVRIIPWGAGKWWFSRGRLLDDLVREFGGRDLFLGDEAGRPAFWPRASQFEKALDHGVKDLPGSDPLPFSYEVDKVGRMGFAVQASWHVDHPTRSLIAALRDSGSEVRTFSSLEPWHRFFLSQFKMQVRKRVQR